MPEELGKHCKIPIADVQETFPWNVELDPDTAKSCQLQQPLNQHCKPGNSTGDDAREREQIQEGEAINQSDGQTAHFHFPVLKPSTGESPARFLVQNSHLSQVFHGERIGNLSREVKNCSRGWVLPHFIYPTSIPNRHGEKGEQGERKELCCFGVCSPAGRSPTRQTHIKVVKHTMF